MTTEHPYGMISVMPTLDVSTWRPYLAEGYLAGQAMERQIRRRRRWSWAITGVSAVLVVGFLAIAGPTEWRSVRTFHAITPWSQPARIHYAGNDYDPSGVPKPRSALRLLAGVPLNKVMRGNHRQPIWAQTVPGLGTGVLYEQRGSKYQEYDLLGGG
jgi:hypothetical protein